METTDIDSMIRQIEQIRSQINQNLSQDVSVSQDISQNISQDVSQSGINQIQPQATDFTLDTSIPYYVDSTFGGTKRRRIR